MENRKLRKTSREVHIIDKERRMYWRKVMRTEDWLYVVRFNGKLWDLEELEKHYEIHVWRLPN